MIWKYRGGRFDLTETGIIMGILNVTPNSFSDGGDFYSTDAAVQQALRMATEGASIIDIGGESTRPGAAEVALTDELERTIPVIEALSEQWDGVISIDTSKPEVARAALEAGAHIVNDVTGLTDPEMVLICRDAGAGIVAMHMQGSPRTMQNNPSYQNVVGEIKTFFQEQYEMLVVAGIDPETICFDPGIGFGKTLVHNQDLIRSIPELRVEERPLLIGLSKKSFIGKLLNSEKIEDREWSTVALTSECRKLGAMIHRVHEVKPNLEAVRMAEAIMRA